MKNKNNTTKQLNSISDIRSFFYQNDVPIYFIGSTSFNLLGADEWIKGFKYISLIDCFDGAHPDVFSPKQELPHDKFESIEEINNYLLEHPEVREYIKKRSKGNKAGLALFLMFDSKTEELAKGLGLEIMFPTAEMRMFMDNKVNTNRIAEKAGVPCVPNVLSPIFVNYVIKKFMVIAFHNYEKIIYERPPKSEL